MPSGRRASATGDVRVSKGHALPKLEPRTNRPEVFTGVIARLDSDGRLFCEVIGTTEYDQDADGAPLMTSVTCEVPDKFRDRVENVLRAILEDCHADVAERAEDAALLARFQRRNP